MFRWLSFENWKGWLAIGAVAVVICVACQGEEDSPTQTSTSSAVERPKAAATPWSRPTSTPGVSCPTSEESEYFLKVQGLLDLIVDQLQVRSGQFAMAEGNESLFLDPQWQADRVRAGENIRIAAQDIRNVAVPVSAVDYHADMLVVADKIDRSMALANEATYELSTYKMEQSNGLMREASQWMDYAINKKQAFCD